MLGGGGGAKTSKISFIRLRRANCMKEKQTTQRNIKGDRHRLILSRYLYLSDVFRALINPLGSCRRMSVQTTISLRDTAININNHSEAI